MNDCEKCKHHITGVAYKSCKIPHCEAMTNGMKENGQLVFGKEWTENGIIDCTHFKSLSEINLFDFMEEEK